MDMAIMKKISYGDFLKKTRNKSIIQPRNPTTGIYPEETTIPKDTCTPVFIAHHLQ